MDLLFSVDLWSSLLLLTILEVILGIDNIVVISILAGRLPEHQQNSVRRIGISLALIIRIIMLFSLVWLAHVAKPLFSVGDHAVSVRDLIMLLGGLFLLYKATQEIHHELEDADSGEMKAKATKSQIITQIVMFDIVFSLDSIITAIGLAKDVGVMIAAVVIAMGAMLIFARPIGEFIQRHRSIKMLALSFLLLVGVTLVAEGMHFKIPKGYLYFAIGFSGLVETLNIIAAGRRKRKAALLKQQAAE